MHESEAVRIGEIPEAEREAHLDALPEETHLVSGSLVGHGATALASDKAKLSAKVVKLERTADGGIDYQLAIFVSEPTPESVAPSAPVEDPKFLTAVEYFIGKGFTDTDARKKVNQFGVERVLAVRERELDKQLEDALAKSE